MSQPKVSRQTSTTTSSPAPVPPNTSSDPCHCRLCYVLIGKKDKMTIMCDYCNKWCHQACAKLDDAAFNALAKSNQKFFCTLCMPTIDRFLRMEKRMYTFEERLMAFDEKLAKLESNKFRPATTIPPLMNFPGAITLPAQRNDDEVRTRLRDELERESKRKNAVLFGLEDTGANDTDVVKQLIDDAVLQDLKSSDVVTVFRDGPDYDDKPRFCKVYLKSVDAKAAFINFINTSRKNEIEGFSTLRSRPDLSFLQRKRARELRDELQTRNNAGENDLYVDYKADCLKRRRRVI